MILAILLVLVMIPGAGFAQDEEGVQAPAQAAPTEQFFKQYDLTGGLNTKQSSYMIQPNESPLMQNLTLDTTFAPSKRPGYAVHSTVSVLITKGLESIYRVYFNNGDYADLVHTGNVFYASNNNGPYSIIAPPMLVTDGSHYAYETYQNRAYIIDQSETQSVYSYGADITAETSFPVKGKYILSSKGRLWIGGSSSDDTVQISLSGPLQYIRNDPNIVYFTSPYGDPHDQNQWLIENNGGFIRLPNDGDVITGMQTVNTFMLIFRKNSIFVVESPVTGSDGIAKTTVRQVSQGIGCIAPRSLVKMEAGPIYFLGKRGVYSYDGSNIEYLSLKVEPDIGRIGDELGLTYKRQYWLVQFGSDTSEMVYDIDIKAWTKYDSIPLSCGFTAQGDVDLGALFIGMSNDGFVYKFGDAAFDNGATFDCKYKTKTMDMGNSFLFKRFRNILVDLRTSLSTVEVQYSIDRDRVTGSVELLNSSSGTLWGIAKWGESTWGGEIFTPMVPLPQSAVGRVIQLEFISNAIDDDFRIFGYGLRYATYPHRGIPVSR